MRRARRNTLWRLCGGAVALVLIATFSPFVIPASRYQPMLVGLPLTFWAGTLAIVAIALLTILGAAVRPAGDFEHSDKP